MKHDILEIIKQCFSHLPDHDNRAKISPRSFLIALIFLMTKDSGRKTIAGMRRAMIGTTAKKIARSSFWLRISSKRLTLLLCSVMVNLINQGKYAKGIAPVLLKKLKVKGIFLVDSSVIVLNEKAASAFPTPKNNGPAAIKWHLCLNLLTALPRWFTLTDGTINEHNEFPPLAKFRGALFIFDLGYWDYRRLLQIIEEKCFFLSRIMPRSKIEIIGYAGKYLKKSKKALFKRNLFDFDWSKKRGRIVELLGSIKLGQSREGSFNIRVIGFWNPSKNCYHWYVTNLTIHAKLIYPLYRLRWQVELTFKAAKSTLSLAEIPSGNEYAIRNIFLASAIAHLIAQFALRAELNPSVQAEREAVSTQRIAIIFIHVAKSFYDFLVINTSKSYFALRKILKTYASEIIDPNFLNRQTSWHRMCIS